MSHGNPHWTHHAILPCTSPRNREGNVWELGLPLAIPSERGADRNVGAPVAAQRRPVTQITAAEAMAAVGPRLPQGWGDPRLWSSSAQESLRPWQSARKKNVCLLKKMSRHYWRSLPRRAGSRGGNKRERSARTQGYVTRAFRGASRLYVRKKLRIGWTRKMLELVTASRGNALMAQHGVRLECTLTNGCARRRQISSIVARNSVCS